MVRKLLALCLAAMLLGCGITVSAESWDPERTGSISVTLTEQFEKTPIAGGELSLYRIAAVGINTDGKLNYMYLAPFDQAGFDLEDPELAAKLDAYLAQQAVTAQTAVTDERGNASFQTLPQGLYLVRQTGQVAGYAPCTPFLVTIPLEGENGYRYDVNATPKTEVAKLTDITIRKVWNTDKATQAADSVTVQLLRGGQLVQTATLNRENNWQVTFTELPESDAYSIKEVNVPKGFTATYKQNAYVFTVTNTSTLIQTGQLIWPIPVLALIGVLLITVGSMLLQKKRKTNA